MPSAENMPDALRVQQFLLVLGLLFGVLLMHGVTDHQDSPAHPAVMSAVMSTVSSPDVGIPDPAADTASGSGPASLLAPMAGHPMAAMCVAVLTAGLLLPVLTGLRIRRRHNDWRLPSPTAMSLMPKAAAARWLIAPSLTRLCVSKT